MTRQTRFKSQPRPRKPFSGFLAGRNFRFDGEAPGFSVAALDYTLISTACPAVHRRLLRM
jgi:hypothetical protein